VRADNRAAGDHVKEPIMRANLLSVVVCVLLAVGASLAKADEKEAIQERIDEFTNAWNEHNPERMAALWAEDGDLINPFGHEAKGREQVRQLFAEEQAGPMRQSRHEMRVDSVRMVGDLALVDLKSTVTGIRGPDDREFPPLNLHIFNVMTRRDGEWMIISARPYAFLPPPGGEGAERRR
jgi:uncharacterized protein (TIGR02246 family)